MGIRVSGSSDQTNGEFERFTRGDPGVNRKDKKSSNYP